MEIKVTNVNQALARGLEYLRVAGVEENSRNGKVIVAPEPVTTIYTEPRERVLFSPLRDANPFFHFMEALWMLAGKNDVAFPAYFAKQIAKYSDDGVTQHGAYGYRWRKWFGFDQLRQIIFELKKNPDSRRCVLAMWDATHQAPTERDLINDGDFAGCSDLFVARWGGKDVPCNTHVYFDARNGELNMTVLCRSNDVLWGAYGANAVHFSILQEYIAANVGVPIGIYRQFSNNFHLYPIGVGGVVDKDISLWRLSRDAEENDLYEKLLVQATPLVTDFNTFDEELERFFKNPADLTRSYINRAFEIGRWFYRAWDVRKRKVGDGYGELANVVECDWTLAAKAWIDSREAAKIERETETR